jgi:transcriptional regulator with XRE-family HTH domain
METTVNQRFIELIKHLKMSDRQFAKATGIPETTLSTYVKRGTNPSSSSLSLILKAFPTVSAKWLLLGDGEMINENEVQLPKTIISAVNETSHFIEMLDRLQKQSAESALKDKEIELLKEKIKKLEDNKLSYGNVAEPILKYEKK